MLLTNSITNHFSIETYFASFTWSYTVMISTCFVTTNFAWNKWLGWSGAVAVCLSVTMLRWRWWWWCWCRCLDICMDNSISQNNKITSYKTDFRHIDKHKKLYFTMLQFKHNYIKDKMEIFFKSKSFLFWNFWFEIPASRNLRTDLESQRHHDFSRKKTNFWNFLSFVLIWNSHFVVL